MKHFDQVLKLVEKALKGDFHAVTEAALQLKRKLEEDGNDQQARLIQMKLDGNAPALVEYSAAVKRWLRTRQVDELVQYACDNGCRWRNSARLELRRRDERMIVAWVEAEPQTRVEELRMDHFDLVRSIMFHAGTAKPTPQKEDNQLFPVALTPFQHDVLTLKDVDALLLGSYLGALRK